MRWSHCESRKGSILLEKINYPGFSVPDEPSKVNIYDFHYNYILKKIKRCKIGTY